MLFVLHHFLNIRWYAVLFKGEYHFRRIIMTASDLLLFFAMLAIMVSSLMISGLAFPISFLPAACEIIRDIEEGKDEIVIGKESVPKKKVCS